MKNLFRATISKNISYRSEISLLIFTQPFKKVAKRGKIEWYIIIQTFLYLLLKNGISRFFTSKEIILLLLIINIKVLPTSEVSYCGTFLCSNLIVELFCNVMGSQFICKLQTTAEVSSNAVKKTLFPCKAYI